MVEVPSAEGGHDKNYPAHVRNYEGFVSLFKWGAVAAAIVTAIVLYIIAT